MKLVFYKQVLELFILAGTFFIFSNPAEFNIMSKQYALSYDNENSALINMVVRIYLGFEGGLHLVPFSLILWGEGISLTNFLILPMINTYSLLRKAL